MIRCVEKAVVFGAILTFAAACLPASGAFADYADDSDHQEARKFLRDRKWSEAVIILRSLHKRKQSDLAFTVDLVKALTNSGRREEALSLLGEAFAREGRAPARDALARRIQVVSRLFFSNSTFQSYQEGLNLLQAQRYRPARERLERALESEPDNVELLIRMAEVQLLDGDADSAAERLKLARKLNAVEPQIRLWLGRAMALRGELRDAQTELRLARKELGRSERSAIWLAEMMALSGDRVSAIEELERDRDANPGHVGVLMALARIRIDYPGQREAPALWASRKDLQLAQSRMDAYSAPDAPRFEGELGLELRLFSEGMREETQKLLQKIDARLEKQGGAAEP